MIKMDVEIIEPLGLYAKVAKEIVDYLEAYSSHVDVIYKNKQINMKSLIGLLSLGIPCKAHMIIHIDGDDENEVKDQLAQYLIYQKIADVNLGG